MPSRANNVQDQQWDTCDRCGRLYPISDLTVQKGLLLCTVLPCIDDLEIERRDQVISRVLQEGADQEGVDLRVVDRAFWQTHDEEVY